MSVPKTLRKGYLLVDNSLSGGARIEYATVTCNHCQKQLMTNPLRNRARAWCPSCDAYICDSCEALRMVAGCKPFSAIIEELARSVSNLRIF
jgi:hypothetical protein